MHYEELERLHKLKEQGAITQEEYEKEKAKILANTSTKTPINLNKNTTNQDLWGMKVEDYCMVMHFSTLTSLVIPFAGLIVPIIMWNINKDNYTEVDKNGKNIVNWIITLAIGYVIGAFLCFAFIGFFIVPTLVIMSIIFAIMGGLEAKKGKVYEYPFSLKLIQ